jgi:hypothetical protein
MSVYSWMSSRNHHHSLALIKQSRMRQFFEFIYCQLNVREWTKSPLHIFAMNYWVIDTWQSSHTLNQTYHKDFWLLPSSIQKYHLREDYTVCFSVWVNRMMMILACKSKGMWEHKTSKKKEEKNRLRSVERWMSN